MHQRGMVGSSRTYGSTSAGLDRRRCVLVVGIFLVALLAPSPAARAEAPAAGSREEARTLFVRGQSSYNVGNYEDAIRDWGAAYAIDPRPLIQYNLSQAYERLGRLVEAIDALDRFIAEAPPGDPVYSEANARLASLRQRLSLTGVRILGGPDGGRIQVDGRDWGVTPRPDRISVEPGQHTITIEYPSGQRFRSTVAVPGGMVVDVSAGDVGPEQQQQHAVGAPTYAAPSLVVGEPAPDRGTSRLPWYIAGGAAAGVGAGVLLYGILRQTELSGCDDPGFTCLNEGTVQGQRTAGMVTGALLMAGGAAVIVVGAVGGRGGAEGSAEVACGIGLGSAACRVEF